MHGLFISAGDAAEGDDKEGQYAGDGTHPYKNREFGVGMMGF